MRNKVLATIATATALVTLAVIPASSMAAVCPPGDTGSYPYCTAPAVVTTSPTASGATSSTPNFNVGLTSSSSSKPITQFTLKLPSGFTFNTSNKSKVTFGGGKSKTESISGSKLSVKLKSGATNITIKLGKGSLSENSAEQKKIKGKKVNTITVTGTAVEGGTTYSYTVTIKV